MIGAVEKIKEYLSELARNESGSVMLSLSSKETSILTGILEATYSEDIKIRGIETLRRLIAQALDIKLSALQTIYKSQLSKKGIDEGLMSEIKTRFREINEQRRKISCLL